MTLHYFKYAREAILELAHNFVLSKYWPILGIVSFEHCQVQEGSKVFFEELEDALSFRWVTCFLDLDISLFHLVNMLFEACCLRPVPFCKSGSQTLHPLVRSSCSCNMEYLSQKHLVECIEGAFTNSKEPIVIHITDHVSYILCKNLTEFWLIRTDTCYCPNE